MAPDLGAIFLCVLSVGFRTVSEIGSYRFKSHKLLIKRENQNESIPA